MMLNIIGHPPPREQLAGIPGVRLHFYDKEPRPGRKIGHVNVVSEAEAQSAVGGRPAGASGESLAERSARVREILEAAEEGAGDADTPTGRSHSAQRSQSP